MHCVRIFISVTLAALLFAPTLLRAQSNPAPHASEPRAREIGIPFDGTTGPFNAITDVAGVEVGYKTLISGEGKLIIGKGPVRTGVTAILPRGKDGKTGVFAGFFSGNGNGDMTGTHWIEERRTRAMQLRTTAAAKDCWHSRGAGNECSAKALRTKAIKPADSRL
jgi:hypothetical protein